MDQEPFITRPMSVALDAMRAIAAFAVLFGHTMQITVYNGYFPYWFVLQHNAVLIFFVPVSYTHLTLPTILRV